MNEFNTDVHTMTLSDDGSYTAYSKEYDEHYHSTKDGALFESLVKHIEPTMSQKKNQNEINILDICFGLGFNTLATIYYHKKNHLTSKLNIYSPELDSKLIESLLNFNYPKEFDSFLYIIESLVKTGIYKDELYNIELFVGDAREYILKHQNNKFDIVYQDAFSPSTNPILWTQEYFNDITRIIKDDGILSTYSTALKIRIALHNNNFYIYLHSGDNFRTSTIASKSKLENFKLVDVEHKISCNPNVEPLSDKDII